MPPPSRGSHMPGSITHTASRRTPIVGEGAGADADDGEEEVQEPNPEAREPPRHRRRPPHLRWTVEVPATRSC